MRHPLLKAVEKIDDELTGLRQEAGPKYNAMTEAQQALSKAAAEGQTIGTDHALFIKADELGRAYGEVSDKITDRETVKSRLITQMGQQGVDPGSDGPSADEYATMLQRLGADADGLLGRGLHKSAGQRISESDSYKALQAQALLASEYGKAIGLGEGLTREELKSALLTGADSTSAGAFVTPDRKGYYPLPMRPLTVLDLITIGQTDSDLVEFVRMTSRTNNAAAVKEAITSADIGGGVTAVQGGLKPESTFAFEVVQQPVSTIAHWVAATKRAIADAGQLRTIIDGELRWGLGDVLERQIVNGDGVGENLLGLLQQTGTNAIPAGASSHADKIHKGITQNRLDGFFSTGILMNPLDAETIWLSREDGSTGAYLFGAPNNPGPRTLWGLPVAETPAIPSGTAMVGNFQAAIFWLREGIQVLASDSHKDWFTRNMVAVLAEMRGGFGVPTPAALCEVNLAAA